MGLGMALVEASPSGCPPRAGPSLFPRCSQCCCQLVEGQGVGHQPWSLGCL